MGCLLKNRSAYSLMMTAVLTVIMFSSIKAGEESGKSPWNKAEETAYTPFAYQIPLPMGGLSAISSRITYPEIAMRAKIEGNVYVRAFIDEFGAVIHCELVRGLPGGCNEAVMQAIRKTKFLPAVDVNNVPIKAQTVIRLRYRLH